jgi:hypothetical protein
MRINDIFVDDPVELFRPFLYGQRVRDDMFIRLFVVVSLDCVALLQVFLLEPERIDLGKKPATFGVGVCMAILGKCLLGVLNREGLALS